MFTICFLKIFPAARRQTKESQTVDSADRFSHCPASAASKKFLRKWLSPSTLSSQVNTLVDRKFLPCQADSHGSGANCCALFSSCAFVRHYFPWHYPTNILIGRYSTRLVLFNKPQSWLGQDGCRCLQEEGRRGIAPPRKNRYAGRREDDGSGETGANGR